MKYSVEIENGVAKETLVLNGKEYTRTTETIDFGCRSRDKAFCEQMENDGLSFDTLDQIGDTLNGFLIGALLKIAESEESE